MLALLLFAVLPPLPVPADNPGSEPKVRLGRYLFYDTRLSVNGTQSCASCHKQELAFTDGRARALGATGEMHPRGAMSLVNVAYSRVLTWTGVQRGSLEAQALIPMFGEHPVELGLRGREAATLAALRRVPVYRVLFPKAFPAARDPFTFENVAKAIASFERTLVSADSPYDRYYSGGEPGAISDAAKRGETVFFSDTLGKCFRCHGGVLFSNGKLHNTGVAAGRGRFKAPTLRNIALTAPYMHDGSIATLAEVIERYAAGGREGRDPGRDPLIAPLSLTARNRADLLEFLLSLTDTGVTRDPRFSNPW